MTTWNNSNIRSDTTPDEVALIFQIPFAAKLRMANIKMEADFPVDIVLYDSDGTTVLETVSVDPDVRAHAGTSVYSVRFSDIVLAANTSYRLAIKPTTTSASVGYEYWLVNAASDWDAWFGGQTWHWSQRTDAGAWTQTTTKRPMIGLMFSEIDIPSGGGGRGSIVGG